MTTATWQRNLKVLTIGVFMTGVSFSEIMPFLSLYVDELGIFTKNELTFYSGLTFSATFLTMALVSPYWGKLSDKYGRRPMLLRSALSMAIIIFAMAFVQNVWELIALRAIQGMLGGYVSNANALIATQTPKENAGQALGILMTGMTAGSLIGPLLGGILASLVSYRAAFALTGVILFFVFILTWIFVKEDFKPVAKVAETNTKDLWRSLPNKQLIVLLFVTTMLMQTVTTAINPIIALFVRELTHGAAATTLLTGFVAAMPGIAMVLAAPRFGKLNDILGANRFIHFGFLLAFVVLIPTGFVTSVYILMFLRFMMGIANAALMPTIQSLLAKNTPSALTGRIFSYNQSFQSLGSVSGPMLGALVAQYFDYAGIFIFSAVLIALNYVLFLGFNKQKADA